MTSIPLSNAQIKTINSLKIKKYRDRSRLFIAEGKKCISELLERFELHTLVLRNDALPINGFDQVLVASEAQMKQLSSLVTPTDYLAIFRIPDRDLNNSNLPNHILALDGVQDPGNLGTIIRTCDWMGIRTILCSPQTADCFAPKVVQATMGALARVQVIYTDLPSTLLSLQKQDYQLLGTAMDGENIYTSSALHSSDKKAIIMGNEGNGITPAVQNILSRWLTIPACAANHVESLNVSIATAIILSELQRNT